MPDNPANWNTFLEHAALSDVGLRRSNNQDAFVVMFAADEDGWRERGHLFMVADGMGAHAAGELASKLACDGVPHTYHKLLDRAAPDALRQAVVETNAHIHGRGEANAEFHGMGTTCSILVLTPQGAIVAQVGDSRIYRLRNERLEQLTFDHSLVWEMMASGQLPAGDVANFVPKNIITRSLGPHAEVKVDLEGPFALQPGDSFLLCSDGLTGQVRDEQLGVILGVLSPTEAVRALVDLANLQGGPDNITVIVARVLNVPPLRREDLTFSAPATRRKRSFSLHPAILVAVGVALLAALGLGLAGSLVAAGASAVAAVLIGLFGTLAQVARQSPRESSRAGEPLGAGPHTVRDCSPSQQSVDDAAQVARKLREAAVDQQWAVDLTGYDAQLGSATAAAAAGDFRLGVRQTILAISSMMNEIRHLRPKKQARGTASKIDLMPPS